MKPAARCVLAARCVIAPTLLGVLGVEQPKK
jgi:hypothetical protein